MIDFFESYKWDKRPFLLLGKGPSFRVPTEKEYEEYNVISLNHVVRHCKVDICHVIDLDVITECGESIYKNCKILLMPAYPHFGFRPHAFLTLDDISNKQPILKKMRDEGRLYFYNLSTASQMINVKWNDSPMVWASFFSAEAVVNLLGKIGVKKIRTGGIDGKTGQAEQFKDLQNVNVNGYDAEWVGIRKSIRKFALDYAPLGVESPIRIFIGAGEGQIVPALVLKHSILKHATMSVDVTIMNEWTHPMPKDARNRPRTPFSFQRFMIPEKCNYQGHAIYMDSDMLVFGDVKEIWTAGYFNPILVMRNDDIDKHKAKYSVMRIDCEKTEWIINDIVADLDSGFRSYEQLVFNLETEAYENKSYSYAKTDGWNSDWNSLEEYTEGKTKLLHYTEMYNQPWLANPNHPLGYLWFNELKELINEEPSLLNLLQDHVKKGWLRKECLELIA